MPRRTLADRERVIPKSNTEGPGRGSRDSRDRDSRVLYDTATPAERRRGEHDRIERP